MKRIILLAFFSSIYTHAYNQINPFTAKQIVWYGIDFSHAKLIGSDEFGDPKDVRDNKFHSWNLLMLRESEKYNVKKFLKKDIVNYDTILVEQINRKVDPATLITRKEYSFGKNVVEEIVRSYTPFDKSGVGLVFIVENFNKPKGKAFIYVTFFDIATKKVLFTEKVKGEPRGFSIRNYWAGSILSVMDRSQGKLKEWSKEFDK